ncbi:hypothetical protein [Acidicapsa ligni]|uniref:hypothetical protein n=1 Tax=Acidicapsa ligni TaxID=542300 RepID=UPI0021DF6857|nr:hypothetical protein [Acidicapsa ligni]
MDSAAMSALAVFGGTSVGSLSPVLSNYVLQRRVARRDLINREIAERQKLYSDFISEAARLHADAMTKNIFDLNELVSLYALTSRIRLVSPDDVVHAAEEMVRSTVQRYGEINMTLEDLREAALASRADPLKRFSTACRKDLQRLVRLAG